jgi:hypothetical protein
LRRLARKQGLVIRKSRSRSGRTLDDHGGYMLLDAGRNMIMAGSRFDLDLDDIERYLA